MKSNFKKLYPEFATVEHHIRRAQAERAAYLGTLFADLIVGSVTGLRRLLARPAPAAAPRGRLIVKASVSR